MSEYLQQIIDNLDFPQNPVLTDADWEEAGQQILIRKILYELQHLSENAQDAIDDIKNRPPVNDYEWDGEEKDTINLYYNFIGKVQEYYLKEAVLNHVIDDSVSDDVKEHVYHKSYTDCVSLLYEAGLIDAGLKGELRQARNERNEKAHDISWLLFSNPDPQEVEEKMKRVERGIVRLIEIAEDAQLEVD